MENEARTAMVPIVIPAYKPGDQLISTVEALLRGTAHPVIVVNDGSGPEFAACFERVSRLSERVEVLHHAVNLGKGAALKTGLNHALVRFPESAGAVTADADGQHDPEDIARIAEQLRAHPGSLLLGVRRFGEGVPWRSRAGNELTRMLMRAVLGQKLADTQTGLRGISGSFIPHLLRMPSNGYEFELDMLIACKHQGCPVVQEPVRTIYLEGNRSSHFHPILDSMRIYFLLLRFSVLSLLTAVLDNTVFALTYKWTGNIAVSQTAARLIAMIFNYGGARSVVFHSRQSQKVVLPRYVLLVACNGIVSYGLIEFLHVRLGFSTIPSKLLAESLLFVANFAIQRDFIFTRRKPSGTATDWDKYYTRVPPTAKLTRRYTTSVLLDLIRRYARPAEDRTALLITEIGGANSCFLESILENVACESYNIIDTNEYGLSLLRDKIDAGVVELHRQSVLDLAAEPRADLVFSVGLIEHFNSSDTRRAILAHFDALRPGGTAILTFPTPTLLYRATRSLLETFGLWQFPDERPLRAAEVEKAVADRGNILFKDVLWPLILTQGIIVAQKSEPVESR